MAIQFLQQIAVDEATGALYNGVNEQPLLGGLTTAQAATTQALVSGAGNNNSAVLLGDSRHGLGVTATTYTQLGYMQIVNQLMGGRLDFRACYAVTGQTANHLRTVQVLQVLAMLPLPRWAFIDVGHNSIVASTSAVDTYADVAASVAALAAAGIRVVLSTSGSSATIAASNLFMSQLGALNNLYKTAGAKLQGVAAVLDVYGCVVNTINGSYDSNFYIIDNTHYNYQGNQRIAAYVKPILDPLIPNLPVFTYDFANVNQTVQNPAISGANAGGVGGFVLGGTNTGTGPNNFTSSRTGTPQAGFTGGGGTAAAVTTGNTVRTDTRAGVVCKMAHTGGAAYECTSLQPGSTTLKNWTSNLAVTLLDRILPTAATGYQYRVVTAGNLFTGADPTATWSTALGTQFASGTATLEVAPVFNIGDSVQAACEIFADSFNGAATFILQLQFLTSASAVISSYYGAYADNSSALPTTVPTYQVIKSLPAAIPATTGIISVKVFCTSAAAVTGNWNLGRIELMKYV